MSGAAVSNVVQFRLPEPEPQQEIVWQCACGCQFFYLHKDGSVQCFGCKTWQAGTWVVDPEGAA